jgi:hypothetical protein
MYGLPVTGLEWRSPQLASNPEAMHTPGLGTRRHDRPGLLKITNRAFDVSAAAATKVAASRARLNCRSTPLTSHNRYREKQRWWSTDANANSVPNDV